MNAPSSFTHSQDNQSILTAISLYCSHLFNAAGYILPWWTNYCFSWQSSDFVIKFFFLDLLHFALCVLHLCPQFSCLTFPRLNLASLLSLQLLNCLLAFFHFYYHFLCNSCDLQQNLPTLLSLSLHSHRFVISSSSFSTTSVLFIHGNRFMPQIEALPRKLEYPEKIVFLQLN